MLIHVLAILSAAAAGGMRIAIPLLVIGLVHIDKLWSDIPILSLIKPQIVVGILTSWSLLELFGTKKLIGLRILQIIQLIFSPLAGGLLAVGVAKLLKVELSPLWLIGIVGGALALALKLVQVGWFFRLGGIPLAFIFIQDILAVILVLFALKAPENGGVIAMLLLWIALHSSTQWRRWYLEKKIKN
jgi:hypothetical protein